MFEKRVRPITSYRYSSDLYNRVLKKKHIIIYGAGPEGKMMKDTLLRAGRKPLFFWDINPEVKVDGFEVKYPDFEEIPKEERQDYLVIMAILINIRGYWSVSRKLMEHGYTEYIHSEALRLHMDAMNCFLYGKGTEGCRDCAHLCLPQWSQCFCLSEKYLGKTIDKNKYILPCKMTAKYNSKDELLKLAERCERFFGYYNIAQLLLIEYKPLENCDEEFCAVIETLIERIKVGIVYVQCVKNDVVPMSILSGISRFKSRINFIVEDVNTEMLKRLDEEGFLYKRVENIGFKAKTLADYRCQCGLCLLNIFSYHLNGEGKIGVMCAEMSEAAGKCYDPVTLDIDNESYTDMDALRRKLENVSSAFYFYGKCERKIKPCEEGE